MSGRVPWHHLPFLVRHRLPAFPRHAATARPPPARGSEPSLRGLSVSAMRHARDAQRSAIAAPRRGAGRGAAGWLLSALLLVACSTAPPRPTPQGATAPTGWWGAAFVLAWPEDAAPAWHRDLLIADQVIRPVLDRHRSELRYWRFHRRAARHGGHRFSFIFYSTADTARQIFAELEADSTVRALREDGRLERLEPDDPERVTRPRIEDSSDAAWPPELQRAWPSFIMGASQTWLDLMQALEAQDPPTGDLDQYYLRLNDRLTDMWQEWGGHAYLHHLSAVFGYEKVWVMRRELLGF